MHKFKNSPGHYRVSTRLFLSMWLLYTKPTSRKERLAVLHTYSGKVDYLVPLPTGSSHGGGCVVWHLCPYGAQRWRPSFHPRQSPSRVVRTLVVLVACFPRYYAVKAMYILYYFLPSSTMCTQFFIIKSIVRRNCPLSPNNTFPATAVTVHFCTYHTAIDGRGYI